MSNATTPVFSIGLNGKRLINGIASLAEKPIALDIKAVDGVFMFGYRKVRKGTSIGYVLDGGLKFGHASLIEHVGRWVYVDASDYWATSAIVGRGEISDRWRKF